MRIKPDWETAGSVVISIGQVSLVCIRRTEWTCLDDIGRIDFMDMIAIIHKCQLVFPLFHSAHDGCLVKRGRIGIQAQYDGMLGEFLIVRLMGRMGGFRFGVRKGQEGSEGRVVFSVPGQL